MLITFLLVSQVKVIILGDSVRFCATSEREDYYPMEAGEREEYYPLETGEEEEQFLYR